MPNRHILGWHFCHPSIIIAKIPWWLNGKVSAHSAGDPVLEPRKIPWRRKWQPTPVLLPRKFHRWRSLVGYSPWGRKEVDMTEQLHFTLFW